jgi:hypothetical protein
MIWIQAKMGKVDVLGIQEEEKMGDVSKMKVQMSRGLKCSQVVQRNG